MLDIRKLRKSFGDLVAVDDVSFTVAKGELVGLLGPNGAGKTTTVSMITGLLRPDRGDVLIDGAPLGGDTDPKKRRIGLVPQDLALCDELSARQPPVLWVAVQPDRQSARRRDSIVASSWSASPTESATA
jgi:ABC-2 type transport system ATP-binding protein